MKKQATDEVPRLSKEAETLYKTVAETWGIEDEPGKVTLLTACQALDRLREAQDAIRQDGLLLTDRFAQKKLHPATVIEKDSRAHLLQALKALNLDLDSLKGGA